MNMVKHSVDGDRMMSAMFASSCKIKVEIFLNIWTKKAFPVFHSKDDVNVYLRVSICHVFEVSPTYGRLHCGSDTSHCGRLSVALMAGYHIASR